MPDLESLLHRVIQGEVEFVVVRGFPAVAYGIDVCCRFSPDNLLTLQGAIADLHPVHRMFRPALPSA